MIWWFEHLHDKITVNELTITIIQQNNLYFTQRIWEFLKCFKHIYFCFIIPIVAVLKITSFIQITYWAFFVCSYNVWIIYFTKFFLFLVISDFDFNGLLSYFFKIVLW